MSEGLADPLGVTVPLGDPESDKLWLAVPEPLRDPDVVVVGEPDSEAELLRVIVLLGVEDKEAVAEVLGVNAVLPLPLWLGLAVPEAVSEPDGVADLLCVPLVEADDDWLLVPLDVTDCVRDSVGLPVCDALAVAEGVPDPVRLGAWDAVAD